MTALPILYSFRRCPYAMRARMALAVSEAQVELREVVLREKPPEMLEASPKGTVPVLVFGNGRVLDESLDIMRWALGQNDPESWLKNVDETLIATNDGPFKQALDCYKYPQRYNLADGIASRNEALGHLAVLDERLTETPFLGGNTCGFTDIALFPFIRQFAETDRTWFDGQPLPSLQKWLGRLLASELFASVMVRHPQWHTGDPALLFPN